jgi:hypothetical protein
LKIGIAKVIHWIGFIIFCFMLFASALDESKDEVFIHLTASSIPLVLAIVIRYIITREFKVMPFSK